MDLLVSLTIMIIFLLSPAISQAQKLEKSHYEFGPFNDSYYRNFTFNRPATISSGALQIPPDPEHKPNNFSLDNRSIRIFFNHSFKLWEEDGVAGSRRMASFNTSFLVNISRIPDFVPGEGFAFLMAPNIDIPSQSYGQYLGLTNSFTDGQPSNQMVAIEFDTFKQNFDPDDNHIGLDIHSIHSTKTVSLSNYGVQLASGKFYMVWIHYDGINKSLRVYMAEKGNAKPTTPVLAYDNLDLRFLVNQYSYFGFAASTGNGLQQNSVHRWNLTVDLLSSPIESGKMNKWIKICLGIGVPGLVLLLTGLAGLTYYLHKKRGMSNPNLLEVLKCLPGMPKEFSFRDLKKATNNFDEKNKLGQGGFGVVYKGVLPNENIQVAVKRFFRDNLKSQYDFLSELTIINRLRHKHLVRLLGWCHKEGRLLLVYDYMPNGSLDKHLFDGAEERTTLEWKSRYNIISGVASALQYLHYEYDQRVVHRDLKASNIMLDSNFDARLGDFGLARALENEKNSYADQEGVPAGTVGYIAPECFLTGKATRSSDVFGFGAVILEVVCGQRPWTKIASFEFFVDWVWWLHREGRILEAVDQRLGNDYVVEEAQRLLLLGLACSHPIASERPKTEAICQIISGSIPVPRVPPFKPAFLWPSTAGPATNSIGTTSDTTPITSCSIPR